MFLDMKKKENRTISMETSPTCTSDVGLLANKNESKKSVKASVARKFRVVKVGTSRNLFKLVYKSFNFVVNKKTHASL